jgi:hypothetical protein
MRSTYVTGATGGLAPPYAPPATIRPPPFADRRKSLTFGGAQTEFRMSDVYQVTPHSCRTAHQPDDHGRGVRAITP